MSNITRSQLRPVDPVLAALVLGSIPNAQARFISRLVPQITVTGQTAKGKIFKAHAPTFMGDPSASLKRAPGAQMQPINVDGPTTVDYEVRSRSGVAGPIPAEDLDENLSPMALDQYHAAAVAAALAIDEEKDVLDLLFSSGTGWATTTNWNGITAGGSVKLDAPGSKAIDAVDSLLESFRAQSSGMQAVDAIMGHSLATAFRRHEDIKKISSGSKFSDSAAGGYVSMPKLKQIFLDEFGLNLEIASVRRRTSNPGQAHVEADLAPDGLWIGILRGQATSLGGMTVGVTPSALAIIRKSDVSMETEWVPGRKSWFVYGDMRSVEKVLDVNMGVLALDGVT